MRWAEENTHDPPDVERAHVGGSYSRSAVTHSEYARAFPGCDIAPLPNGFGTLAYLTALWTFIETVAIAESVDQRATEASLSTIGSAQLQDDATAR